MDINLNKTIYQKAVLFSIIHLFSVSSAYNQLYSTFNYQNTSSSISISPFNNSLPIKSPLPLSSFFLILYSNNPKSSISAFLCTFSSSFPNPSHLFFHSPIFTSPPLFSIFIIRFSSLYIMLTTSALFPSQN